MKFIVLVIIILVIYVVYVVNKLIKYKNNVNDAFSTMDVYLKKRWDLIPNLVEIVKSYDKYESDTLENVISLRYDSLSSEEKVDANINVSRFLVLVEDYPELRSNDNYLKLASNLSSIENDIANARKYYNATVREYNNLVEVFPSNIIAKIFGYKKMTMFVISEEERDSVLVKLDE